MEHVQSIVIGAGAVGLAIARRLAMAGHVVLVLEAEKHQNLTVWGAMWGVSGLFLAVPLMMVLAIVLAQFDSTRPVAILMSKNGKVVRS